MPKMMVSSPRNFSLGVVCRRSRFRASMTGSPEKAARSQMLLARVPMVGTPRTTFNPVRHAAE
jgi:hypothetical protein